MRHVTCLCGKSFRTKKAGQPICPTCRDAADEAARAAVSCEGTQISIGRDGNDCYTVVISGASVVKTRWTFSRLGELISSPGESVSLSEKILSHIRRRIAAIQPI